MTEARHFPETQPTLGEMLLRLTRDEIQGFLIVSEDFDFKYQFTGNDGTLPELAPGELREPITSEMAIDILTVADGEELFARGKTRLI